MRSGDLCESCQVGVMKRYKTMPIVGMNRTRYLKCDCCGCTGKELTRVDELGRDAITRAGNKTIQCPCCRAIIQT
jgi:hypothetical protein